jgi:hypothetical protein
VFGAELPAMISRSFKVGSLLACFTTMSCGVAPPPESVPAQNAEPEWIRSALQQSAAMMENRCPDLAPLEILYTGDPTFLRCMAEASFAASVAWQEVYDDALRKCVSTSTSSAGATCCFARAPQGYERRQLECDDECGRRSGREQALPLHDATCHPVMVTPPRPSRSRAHTAAVVQVVSRCARGLEERAACATLPTYIERLYCGSYCEAERARFNTSLLLCLRDAMAGGAADCSVDDAVIRQECTNRCREQSRARPR